MEGREVIENWPHESRHIVVNDDNIGKVYKTLLENLVLALEIYQGVSLWIDSRHFG